LREILPFVMRSVLLKRLVIIQLFAFILLLPLAVSALENGVVAPDFQLPATDGKIVSLSDFKGQVILLKLATTWCPACQEQSREIRNAELQLDGTAIVLVEVFLQETAEAVRSYQTGSTLKIPAVALLDDDRVRRSYNVYTIPRMLIIDRQMHVRRDGGLLPAAELIRLVSQIGPA